MASELAPFLPRLVGRPCLVMPRGQKIAWWTVLLCNCSWECYLQSHSCLSVPGIFPAPSPTRQSFWLYGEPQGSHWSPLSHPCFTDAWTLGDLPSLLLPSLRSLEMPSSQTVRPLPSLGGSPLRTSQGCRQLLTAVGRLKLRVDVCACLPAHRASWHLLSTSMCQARC